MRAGRHRPERARGWRRGQRGRADRAARLGSAAGRRGPAERRRRRAIGRGRRARRRDEPARRRPERRRRRVRVHAGRDRRRQRLVHVRRDAHAYAHVPVGLHVGTVRRVRGVHGEHRHVHPGRGAQLHERRLVRTGDVQRVVRVGRVRAANADRMLAHPSGHERSRRQQLPLLYEPAASWRCERHGLAVLPLFVRVERGLRGEHRLLRERSRPVHDSFV